MSGTIDHRRVLEALSDAVVISDGKDRIRFVNGSVESLLGWRREELMGQPLALFMPVSVRDGAGTEGASRQPRRRGRLAGAPIRLPVRHKDGRELDVELTLTELPDVDGTLLLAACLRSLENRIDVEERMATDRHLLAQYRVLTALARESSLAAAAPEILESLCQTLGWSAGLYWEPSTLDPAVLELRSSWAASDPSVEHLVRASAALRPAHGEGAVGRAWASRTLVWSAGLLDDPHDGPRIGDGVCVKGLIAFPIIWGRRVRGVVECVHPLGAPPTEALTHLLTMLGLQIGQFMERVEVEAEAMRKAQWLSTTLRSIGDAVIATDLQGRVSFMNPVAERLTGWSGSEAAGLPLQRVFHRLHEETRQPLVSPVAQVLREHEVPPQDGHALLLSRSGAESVIQESAAPIKTDAGVLQGVVLVFRDVTEKRRTEAELARLLAAETAARAEADHQRDTAAFLDEATAVLGSSLDAGQTLARLAPLVIPRLGDWCIVHLEGSPDGMAPRQVVMHADPARAAWARAFLGSQLGRSGAPFGVPGLRSTEQPILTAELRATVLEACAENREQHAFLRELGLCSAMTVPLRARSECFGWMTFATAESGRTLTGRELAVAHELARRAGHALDNSRLYREAQEAIQMRDDFLSIASHELRTPLTPLQLQLQALHRATRQGAAALSPERVGSKLEVIGRQVVRLERLVTSLLDISRITGRRLTLELEDVDLVQVLGELVARVEEQARQVGSTLILESPSAVLGRWDRLRLEQIVTNLISNALKFGGGRPIRIRLEAADTQARLEVIDQGIGILPEDQARIFERFERAVPTRHFGGFGLGLWIVRQLVEAMGGTIRVESAEGSGSCFQVELPRTPPAAAISAVAS